MLSEKNQEPLVSVLMAAYNAERTVREAVESVFHQEYSNWELLVVDDASSDGTPGILAELSAGEPRMKVFRNKRNLGFSGTRNRLLELASSQAEYLAVLDSDDLSYPKRLQLQVAFLQSNPEFAAVGCCLRILNAEGRVIGRRDYPLAPSVIREQSLQVNPVPHSSLMVRHSIARQVGGYDSSLACCEDYDYIMRILERGEIGNLTEYAVGYRLSDAQHTARHVKSMLSCTLAVQRRYLFHKGNFQWRRLMSYLSKYLLFLLPSRLILWLSRRISVKRES